MTNELNNKRLSDDDLEAVSGGVTSQPVDPAVLAAQSIQSALSNALAVATGGAHPVDTPAPAPTHTDTNSQGHFRSITVTNAGSSHSSGSFNSAFADLYKSNS